MASASAPWVSPSGWMNSSGRTPPTVAGLRFVVSMVTFTYSYGRPDRGRSLRHGYHPTERPPPLPVDADRIKAREIAAQFLEMIAGRHAQVLVGRRVVDHLELPKETAFEIGRNATRSDILDEKSAQPHVPKAHDHAVVPRCVYVPLY